MKKEILELLRQRKNYVSGEEISAKFGVSRTAVWKAVKGLEKEGYVIDAVRNRGYLLVEADIYNKEEIEAAIHSDYIGRNCYFYEETGSTNTEAKRLADEGAPEGTLVVADRQTAGKGRRGRSWDSPAGSNIYFTLMLRPEFSPNLAPMLTLIMALAVAEAIKEEGGEKSDVQIKWPNDVIVCKKKVCGILTEMNLERDYIQNVVIGVGINVKKQEFAPEIAQRATCLDTEFGKTTNRSRLIGKIMYSFEKYYDKFKTEGSLARVKDSYEALLANKGREVCILDPRGEYRGTALGINDQGELIVERENKEITAVYAGEVSVRGIYGYV